MLLLALSRMPVIISLTMLLIQQFTKLTNH
nr:MAG TPA: hypothetical protein [Bacteriophage sp.]